MNEPATALTAGTDGALIIADAPRIPGLHFRAYRDEADLAAMVEVCNASMAANGENETWSLASLAHEIANLTNIDPWQDYVLAFVEDRLVAYSEIEWADDPHRQRHYRSAGFVLPRWRRRGIGTAMLHRNEDRLREIAATHDLEKPAVLLSLLADLDSGGLALFRSRGYERVRTYHHMVRADLKDVLLPAVPSGLEIRTVTDANLKPMWHGLIEAFHDHFGGLDGSDASFQRHIGDPGFGIDLCVAAFDGDEIAGAVLGYVDPAENLAHGYLRGWTDPLWVRRPWRRRGLATALLGRALIQLRERGLTSAQLEVDSQNPNEALGLYKRHRFVTDYSRSEWHRPLDASG